jgi:hypothetical protein
MKKTTLLFATAALLSIASISNAQDSQDEHCFRAGSSGINLGVGIGNTIVYDNGYGGYAGFSPAFTASYEYGIAHAGIGTIGAGIQFGFQGSEYTYANGNGYVAKERWTTLAFSPRATYHFDVLTRRKIDFYPIVQLNVYSYGYSYTETGYYKNGQVVNRYTPANANSVGIYPSVLIAVRYFVTPNFGFYSELGYDITIIKAGFTFKFGGN